MPIGPFTTYAPPGVFTRTTSEPVAGQVLGGIRIPVLIGTGQESLSQSNIEIIRGSSSVADTPIFGEDVASRWVVSGSNSNPTLGAQDGSLVKFRTRNYPVVDGAGVGRTTFDASKVSVTVNGTQVVVAAIDGTNGIVTLLVPPTPTDVVAVNYFFHRKDIRATDDVSSQVTSGQAVLIAPKAENYVITLGSNDKLDVTVDDTTTTTITLTPGTQAATAIATDIISAAISGLSASVHIDNQGFSHVQLIAAGNVRVGSGSANGVLGFNPGDYTNRNKAFRVFNGPIVDGSDGGITTNDPSKITVLINGSIQVIPSSVDGANRLVTLPYAPTDGSTVAITYYFNTWQDTFDYLPNSNIVSVGNVGIGPDRRDYLNGPDFIVVNDGDQSKIQWGTAFQVQPGLKTGSVALDSTQIFGMLIDDRIYGTQCQRFTDPLTSTVSTTKFILPLTATSGNGRDTPLGTSLFQTITNDRIDLPTNRPDLITAYVGKNFRDAIARPAVVVLGVDSSNNTITLRDPVPAEYQVFATFWYNRIADDVYTFDVSTPGPTGIGQYTVKSQLTGSNLMQVKFGTKTALPQTIQWPSGVETVTDAIHDGSGVPVPETITVTFDSSLDPATHASFSNAHAEPYDVYTYTDKFGGIIIDGAPVVTVDLSTPYKAVILSQGVSNPLAFLSTDRLVLKIDGVTVAPINISADTTLAAVVTTINAAIDADTQIHVDGSGTFASTSPNALASSITYGSQNILVIKGRNLVSATNGLISEVTVQSPTSGGQTDASSKIGLVPNQSSIGSYNTINQPAILIGTKVAPYNVTLGVNDSFQLNIDGLDFATTIPSGSTVTLDSVVTAINDSYMSVASSADIATYTADVIALANNLRAKYEAHRPSITYHAVADGVNVITAPVAVVLADALTLLNDIKVKFNAHRTQATVHQLNDTVNVITTADATNLQTAVALAYALKVGFNMHLLQIGVHGYNDTVNVEAASDALTRSVSTTANVLGEVEITTTVPHGFTTGDRVYVSGIVGTTEGNSAVAGNWTIVTTGVSSFTLTGSVFVNPYISGGTCQNVTTEETLLNDLKAKYNAHRTQAGVHIINDTTNIVTAANITTDDVNGPWTQAAALANDVKAQFNAHIASTSYHTVADTTNTVATANATAGSLTSVMTLANALKAAYNAHRVQVLGSYNVHSTTDIVNTATAALTELVAKTGLGINAGKLVITSRVNTPDSAILVKTSGTANTVLGFTPGATAGRHQPTALNLATALNYTGAFLALAVAYSITAPGLGNFLRIDSRSVGTTSTIAFSSVANTTFVSDTNIGITPGVSGDVGENAQSGFSVTSSAGATGSSGTGIPGRTFTASKTGLRFTILPASAGDYASGGSFKLLVGTTFTCDAAIPTRAVPGVEVTVFNTVNTNAGTTATLTTYSRTGSEPRIGDVYYISYNFAKTDLSTGLFQDFKKIQQNFGPPTPEFSLSLAAKLALLNGSVLVGLKQVLRDPATSQAPSSAYVAAIDEQRKPIGGSVKPDLITPLSIDPAVFAYLNQHCVFMSSPRQEGERTGVVGVAAGTSPLGVQAIAKSLLSELMIVAYPDSYVVTIQDDAGNLIDQLVDGTFMAAALAGTLTSSAVDVATPLTRRQITGFKQVGRSLDPTEANQVAVAGVTIIEQVDTILRVRHGLTTRPDTVLTRTPSVTLTIQFVQQSMRRVLDPYIGQKFTASLLKSVEGSMVGAFSTLIDQQIVSKVSGIDVGVDENDPTILRASAIYVPVFPLEYIIVSLGVRIRI